MKTYYTIYKITNTINNKIYIGMHQTKNLDDGYYGSGNLIKRAITKYGIESFTKEYLAVFDEKSKMVDLEIELVNENFIDRCDTYNIKRGGEGGWDHIKKLFNTDKEWLTKHSEKISNGVNLYYKKIGTSACKGRCRSDDVKLKIGKTHKLFFKNGGVNGFKGKHHTDETKCIIGEASSKRQRGEGNSQFGTMWICNNELKQSKKILKTEHIPEGWIKGRSLYKF